MCIKTSVSDVVLLFATLPPGIGMIFDEIVNFQERRAQALQGPSNNNPITSTEEM